MITKDFGELGSFTDTCPESTRADVAQVMEWQSYWKNEGEGKLFLSANEKYLENQEQVNDLFRSIEAKHSHDNYFGAATSAAEVAKIVAPSSPVGEANGCDVEAKETKCKDAGCYFCTQSSGS